MYKLKTRKSAQNRYKKITKNNYSYKHAYKGHLLFHKKKVKRENYLLSIVY